MPGAAEAEETTIEFVRPRSNRWASSCLPSTHSSLPHSRHCGYAISNLTLKVVGPCRRQSPADLLVSSHTPPNPASDPIGIPIEKNDFYCFFVDFLAVGEAALAADLITACNTMREAALAADLITAKAPLQWLPLRDVRQEMIYFWANLGLP